MSFASPQDAIREGLGLVAEDRKLQSLVLERSVTENATLAALRLFVNRFRVIDQRSERRVVERVVRDLSIKTPSVDTTVANLSGGNQQKVVVGKFLLSHIVLFLLDEPTRGIDVGAKAEIYQLVSELALEGTSFLLVSSEMPELLAVCDRIYVLCDGRVTGEFERDSFDQEAIMEAATRFVDDDRDSTGEPADPEPGRMSIGSCAGVRRGTLAPSRLSLVDGLRLVATLAALIAFLVLPWFIDGGVTVSGLVVLVSGTSSLAPEAGAALAQVQLGAPADPGRAHPRRSRSRGGPVAAKHRTLGLAGAPGRPGRRGLLHPLPRPRSLRRQRCSCSTPASASGSPASPSASCSCSTSPCERPAPRTSRLATSGPSIACAIASAACSAVDGPA